MTRSLESPNFGQLSALTRIAPSADPERLQQANILKTEFLRTMINLQTNLGMCGNARVLNDGIDRPCRLGVARGSATIAVPRRGADHHMTFIGLAAARQDSSRVRAQASRADGEPE
jgi:hypothetical protein